MCFQLEPRLALTAPAGVEMLVNQAPSELQNAYGSRSIASDASGRSIVVWESYNQDALLTWGIRARLLNADGTQNGSEFQVNTDYILFDQRQPQVAMNASGQFVIAWEGRGLLGAFPGIYVQRYDADGTRLGTTIGVAGSILLSVANAAVGIDDDGNFVVAYESTDATLSTGIFAQRYAADGTPIGSEFRANSTTSGAQVVPAVAMAGNGSFAIAWNGNGSGDSSGVFAALYNNAGGVVTSERLINATTTGTQNSIAITCGLSGEYVAVWSGQGTGDSAGVFYRVMSSSGSMLTSEQRANQTTTGTQELPSVIADADGDFVVSWSGQGSTDAAGVYSREFDASAVAKNNEFQVNETVAGTQTRSSVVRIADNSYIVAWSGSGTGDTDGAFARLLANELPTVTVSVGSNSYTENAAAIAIDSGITIADADSATLSGATVRISSGYVNGQDILSFTDVFGIVGSWNAATSILTLTGTATVAQYQTALRSVSYVNVSDDPSTTTRSVELVVSDGVDSSTPASRNLTIVAVNDSPVVVVSSGSVTYTENDPAVVIDLGIAVSDLDSGTLTGATVRISAGYANGQDVLSFTNGFGISGNWNAATGVLTLSGTATVVQYQAALRSVLYVNMSDDPSTTTRSVEFVVSDGLDSSAPASRNLAIVAVNDLPVVTTSSGSVAYTENDPAVVIDSGMTITDADSTTLSGATVRINSGYVSGQDSLSFTDVFGISGNWNAATGVLTLSGTATVAQYQAALRSVSYINVSDDPSTTTRSVEFVVSDGLDSSTSATRNLVIVAVNDAPVVTTSNGSVTYTENDPAVAIDSGVTIVDSDSATLSSATVRISSGYINGQDTLSFTDVFGISGSWDAATGVLTLSGTATVAQYQTALRSVTYINVSDDPSTATRSVEFVVSDGADSSTPASKNLTIVAANDSPVVSTSSGAVAYTENDPAVAIDSGITITDVDSATLSGATVRISSGYVNAQDVLIFTDAFGISGNWNAATGVLTLSGTATVAQYQAALRSVSYVNVSDDPSTATRSVEFVVSDGVVSSSPISGNLVIAAVNDLPVVATSSGAVAYTENDPAVAIDSGIVLTDVDSSIFFLVTVRVAAGYSISEDILSFVDQNGIVGNWNGATGVLTLSGAATLAEYQAAIRTVMYANASDDPSMLTRVVEVAVWDGSDWSSGATRQLEVTPVNDVPVVVGSGGLLFFVENSAPIEVDSAIAITDVDSATLTGATVRIVTGYASDQDELIFTDQNGIVGSWNASTGTLTLTGNASLAAYLAALRSIAYINTSDDPSATARVVEFVVNDGAGLSVVQSRIVEVTAVNDVPVVVSSSGVLFFIENSAPIEIDPAISITDVDSATLTGATVRIVTGYASDQDELIFTDQNGIVGSWNASTGTLTLTGNATIAAYQAALRSISYLNTSDDPSTATRVIEFVVNDGASLSIAQDRTVEVTAVNDAPTILTSGGTVFYVENASAAFVDDAILLDDVDSSMLHGATVRLAIAYVMMQDVLSSVDQNGITGIWDVLTGTLTLSGVASVAQYQAVMRTVAYSNGSDDPVAGARTVEFRIFDGIAWSALSSRNVEVTAVNDAPNSVASAGSSTYVENSVGVFVDDGFILTDVDSATLSSATVQIFSGFVSSEDVLIFSDQNGIVGFWNSSTGILTLTGIASAADYQAALRSVIYFNSSDDPSTITRSVEFVVFDGLDASIPAGKNLTIVAVNDSPVVATSSGTVGYTENDSGVVIDSGLTIADPDSATLSEATVRISSGYVNGQDVLSFTDIFGITGNWDAVAGVLTLSGNATVAQYQVALRSVVYFNSSDDPSTAARTIEFLLWDGAALSVPASRNVDVVAVNDAPTISVSVGSVTYVENDVGIELDSQLTTFDVDSLTLQWATVRIAFGYRNGEDILDFADQAGIVGSWDASTGILTLSGAASKSAYQAALRSVTYRNTSDDPSTDSRLVEFVVFDGLAQSTPENRDLQITAVVDAPVVAMSSGSSSYTENSAASIVDLGLSLMDVDSALFTSATIRFVNGYVSAEDSMSVPSMYGLSSSWDAPTGTLTITGVATVAQYQAALQSVLYINSSENPSTLSRTVECAVFDGIAWSLPATRGLDVVAVNDAPSVMTSAGAAVYTENDAGVAIDTAMTIADVDSLMLASVVIRIASGYVDGEDVLSFVDQSSIIGVWDPSTGTLTLSGVASVAQYEAALRAVTYLNLSDDPANVIRTIEFLASDGLASSIAAFRDVTVLAINDNPVVAVSSGSVSYVENGVGVAVDPALSLTDVDSLTLTQAVVRIAWGYMPGEDLLIFSSFAGIAGSWNPATGTLTFSGVATQAEYQAILRTVQYINTSENPSMSDRVVEFFVFDGGASSTPASRSVQVVSVNDQPILAASTTLAFYTENDLGSLVAPDLVIHDVDSSVLTQASVWIASGYVSSDDVLSFTAHGEVAGQWDPQTGRLSFTGNASVAAYQALLRSVRFRSNGDNPVVADRRIEFTVSDGSHGSLPIESEVRVIAVNDAPVLASSLWMTEYVENDPGQQVAAGLTINDVDSPVLVRASLRIVNYVAGQDFLALADQPGFTVSWDDVSGTLNLSGTASIQDYLAALQQVVFWNTSDDPLVSQRSFEVLVNDGAVDAILSSGSVNFIPVNDAPNVLIPNNVVTFVEGSNPTPIYADIQVLDVDSLLTGARVVLFDHAAGDVLAINDAMGLNVSWNDATGELSLTGVATSDVYESVLRGLSYYTQSDDPSGNQRRVSIVLEDEQGLSTSAERVVGVQPIDDALVITITQFGLQVLTTIPIQVFAGGLDMHDPDSIQLNWAEVRIASGLTGGDTLIGQAEGMTVSYDTASGILRFEGSASLAAFQAALSTVVFLAQDAGDGYRQFSVTTSGSNGPGAAMDATVRDLVNDQPPDPPPEEPVDEDPDPQFRIMLLEEQNALISLILSPQSRSTSPTTPPNQTVEPETNPQFTLSSVDQPPSVVNATQTPSDPAPMTEEGPAEAAQANQPPENAAEPAEQSDAGNDDEPAGEQREGDKLDAQSSPKIELSLPSPDGVEGRGVTNILPSSGRPEMNPSASASQRSSAKKPERARVEVVLSSPMTQNGKGEQRLIQQHSFLLFVSSSFGGAAVVYLLWASVAAVLSRRAAHDVNQLWSLDLAEYLEGAKEMWNEAGTKPSQIIVKDAA